ncbi:MAG: class I SAM-dependent methyltransferase [Thermoleophilaceae bacterium]
MPFSNTGPLREEIARVIPDRPFRVEFWDGTSLPATASPNGDGASGSPTFTVRSPKAVAQALAAPGQLGLGRAYATGTLEVDDIDAVMALLRDWSPPPIERQDKLKLAAGALRAAGLTVPPRAPAAELKPKGRRHTKTRDQRAVRHHYDVSNDYFRLFLDESMTYSCAIFSRGAKTLEEAQVAKNDLVATKLGLREGMRIVDIGSGWGAFAIHAAKQYGTHVTGITLSEHQAGAARRTPRARGRLGPDRVPRAGLPRPRRRDVRRRRLDRHGRARRRGADRRVRAQAGLAGEARRAAAQPRHRPPAPRRPGGGAVLRALRVPRRPPHPRVTDRRGLREGRDADAARRGLQDGLRRDARSTGPGASTTTSPRPSAWAGRADPRLAALPAGRPQRLRDGLHRRLSGAGTQGGLRRELRSARAVEPVEQGPRGCGVRADLITHVLHPRLEAGEKPIDDSLSPRVLVADEDPEVVLAPREALHDLVGSLHYLVGARMISSPRSMCASRRRSHASSSMSA